MATSANQVSGLVASLKGNAWVVGADGLRRALQTGDTVEAGQKVITEDGATLELALPNGQTISVASGREMVIDATMLGTAPVDASEAALQALNAGTADIAKIIAEGGDLSAELDATAAGLIGGDAADSHSFVRILRIEELLVPLTIARDATVADTDVFTTNRNGIEFAPANSPTPTPTTAGISNATVAEGGNLAYTVTLSNAGGVPTTFSFGIAGSGANPISVGDIGAPTFSNGVTFDAATQTITVPAGVSSFTVTIPVVADTTAEPTETLTLTVGDLIATGTILDTNPVAPVNEAPVATATTASGKEDDVSIAVALTGTDMDGSIASVKVTVLPAAAQGVLYLADGTTAVTTSMVLTSEQANSLVFKPAANFNGDVTLSFTVTDNQGLTSTSAANAVITVTSVNDAPTATPSTSSGNEDTNIAVALAGTDIDGTIASVKVTVLPAAAQGVLYLSDGTTAVTTAMTLSPTEAATLVFKPAIDFNGPVTVSFTVTDNDSNTSAAANQVITVTPVNDASVMATDSNTVLEDNKATGNVLTNDSDVDDSLSVATFKVFGDPTEYAFGSTATIAGQGTLTIAANGDYTFTPALNFNGSVPQVTYTTNTGSTSTLDIAVTPVNDTPTASAVTLTAIAEDSGARVITAAELLGDAKDVEGNTLTVGNVSIASGAGALVNNGNGTWTYTPALNDDTSVSFNYTITDNGTTNDVADAKSVAGTATLDITPVNDTPTASAVTLAAIAEDSGVKIITADELLGDAKDFEGDTLTVSNVSIASGIGTLVNNGNGTWSYTPAANDDTSVSFNYTITDNGTTNGVADAKSVAGTATLDITPVNDAPVATATTASGKEDDASIPVTLTGTDIDGSVASVKVTALPTAAQGVLYLADGITSVTTSTVLTSAQANSLVFKPAANFNGDVTLSFTVTDNQGLASTSAANAVITVAAVNDAPTTSAVTLTAIAEDSGARVITVTELLGDAKDVEGNILTVSNVSIASGVGSLVNNNNGTWTYTPAANDDTSVSFNYTITDNGTTNGLADAKSVAGTATLDITPVNDTPTASAVTLTAIAEDSGARVITAAELLGDANDVEVNTLTVSNVSIASGNGILVNNNNGTWTYTPAANDDTNVSFNYTITDNGTTNGLADAKSVAGTATLDITPVNDAPVAVLDTGALKEDALLTVDALNGLLKNDTDVDLGDTRSITLITQGANSAPVGTTAGAITSNYGTLTVNSDGSYSYVANGAASQALKEGAKAIDTFTYTLTDASGLSSITTLALTITGTNDAPVLSNITGASEPELATGAAQDIAAKTGLLSVSDLDVGDTLTASITGTPTLALSSGALSGAQMKALTEALITNKLSFAGTPTSDGAGKSIGYTWDPAAANLDFLRQGQTLTVTYAVKVNDGTADSATQNVAFTITGTNNAPVLSKIIGTSVGEAGNAATQDITPQTGLLSVSDLDMGDTLTASITGTPTLALSSGALSAAQMIALKDALVTGKLSFTSTATSDGAGKTIGYTWDPAAANLDFLRQGQTLTVTYAVKVNDDTADSATQNVAFTITGTNDAPTAVGTLAPVTQNDSTSVFLSTASGFADKDVGDVLTYTATGLPPGLSINALTGDITGTLTSAASQGGTSGKYTIQVTVNDGIGTVTQPFSFTVLNPPPVAGNDTALVNKDATLTVTAGDGVISNGFSVAARDIDPDRDTLSVIGVRTGLESSAVGSVGSVGSVLHGLYGDLTLKSDGSYTYVANHAGTIARGTSEVDTFTYTVSDSQGGTDTAQLSISVYGTNTAPVAGNDTNAASEDGVSSLTVTAANGVIQSSSNVPGRDTDAENETVRVVGIRTGAETATGTTGSVNTGLAGAYGTLTIQADGSYKYDLANSSPAVQNLNAGQVVQDSFTYTVSDGNGGFDTATLTINVTGAQDLTAGPPVITPLPPGVGGTATGLNGEYYGYNDSATSARGIRTHSDDGQATFGLHGNAGNLNSVEDMIQIINGRNALANGAAVVGTSNTSAANVADVAFQARTLNYGFNPQVDSSLGSNAALSTGAHLTAADGNTTSTTGALSNFLYQDQPTGVVQTGMGNTNGTSGLGTTSDAAVRLSGQFYVQPGQYDFRVTADDGFRLQVAGQTLLEFDGNQGPTTRVFTNVALGDLSGGLQSIELLYWEQGGNARLKVEYKASNDLASAYQVMSLSNTPLFSNESAPVLTDTRIQDLVYDVATSAWQLRTGAKLDGDAGNNTITGGASRDFLSGGDGDDTLYGRAGADTLDGGAGNNTLNGGDGNDLLIGGIGTNVLIGEKGDDFYRLSSITDTITEKAGEGYDTVQLDTTFIASYSAAPYVLGANLENLTAYGDGAINLTGNSAANRIEGNKADNIIIGGTGNDYIAGGGGSDTLTGDTAGSNGKAGSDVFAWHLGDGGTVLNPAADKITDFNYGSGYSNIGTSAPAGGGDVLDLRDLLVGERTSVGDTSSMATIGNLLNYIRVEVKGADTLMHISTTGGLASAGTDFSKQDQTITLQNVNLYTDTGVASGNESVLLQTLLKRGTLIVD